MSLQLSTAHDYLGGVGWVLLIAHVTLTQACIPRKNYSVTEKIEFRNEYQTE